MKWILSGAVVCLAAMTLAGCSSKERAATSGPNGSGSSPAASSQGTGFNTGQTAPGFQLRDVDGHAVSLADYRGKVVMVDFWATWCGPCRMELPDLKNLYSTYKPQGFEILGLSVDEDPPSVVKKFAATNGIPYRIVMADQDTQGRYGVRAYPTTLLIDRNGVIRARYIGVTPRAEFEQALKPLLATS